MKSLTPVAVISAVLILALFVAAAALGVVVWRAAANGTGSPPEVVRIETRELLDQNEAVAFIADITVPAGSEVRLTTDLADPDSGSGMMIRASSSAGPKARTACVTLFAMVTHESHTVNGRVNYSPRYAFTLKSGSGHATSSGSGGWSAGETGDIGERLSMPLSDEVTFTPPSSMPVMELDGKTYHLVVTPPGR